MPSAAYDIIRSAIVAKQQVFATYHGYSRELCPHTIGTTTGVERVLCYQFGGNSSQGRIVPDSPDNWRCMNIGEMVNITVADGPWHSVSPHTKPQSCIGVVDLEVSH